MYVDTSVFGGVHDDEFREPSERFFAAVRIGAFTILVSDAITVEISASPASVQATFEQHRTHMEALETTVESAALAQANVLRGYPLLEIRSPREVIDEES